MLSLRSLLLIPLWLRLKRLVLRVVTKRPSWKFLTEFYSIVNDWMTLTREPIDPTIPSESGQQVGADLAQDTKPTKSHNL